MSWDRTLNYHRTTDRLADWVMLGRDDFILGRCNRCADRQPCRVYIVKVDDHREVLCHTHVRLMADVRGDERVREERGQAGSGGADG